MTESVDYRSEFNIEDFVDKYVERVNREIDQRVLDKVEHRLAEYGYVKVVRCRDCAYIIHFFHHDDERWQCTEPHQEGDAVKPDAYCWRGKRMEGQRMSWFEQYTAYQPMQTTTTATTWSGWQIMNRRCYKCIHFMYTLGIPTCYCASRTTKRGIHGDMCLSFKGGGDGLSD